MSAFTVIASITEYHEAYSGKTTVHPVGLLALFVCAVVIFTAPKRSVALSFLALIAFVPSAQRIVVFSLDFNFLRIAILCAFVRFASLGEYRGLKPNYSDVVLLFWGCWSVFAYTALHQSPGAFVTRCGHVFESLGAYLLGRIYLPDTAAFTRAIRILACVSVPVMVFFVLEKATGRNMFSALGGVPFVTLVREGRLRCQGPFSHPIMAGVFWASLMPLFAAAWICYRRIRPSMTIGLISSAFIVASCASSTPLLSVAFGAFFLCLYWIRSCVPLIALTTVVSLPLLHLAMNNGVHSILARVNLVGGSSGWHRYYLVDNAIKRFDEWFLVGTQSTAHWGRGLQDVTNQYVLEGVSGGFLSMLMFWLFLVTVVHNVSLGLKASKNHDVQLQLWSLGVVIWTHAACFMAVSYFGQVSFAFFFFAGGVVSCATAVVRPETRRQRTSEQNASRFRKTVLAR